MFSSDAPYQKHIHFVGVGGTGLSAIAQVLLERGYRVSGSDRQASPATDHLAAQGAQVYIGHAVEHIQGVDLVVISSAVPVDNPEVTAARAQGLPVLKRNEFIGQMLEGQQTIAVAGTHGKTTTTAMIAFILSEAGLDPGFIIGGLSGNLGTNARHGRGPHFVIEADEYDFMFLGLTPHLAIVTNVEMDHPDCFGCIEDVVQAFRAFLSRVPPDGCIIANGDERRVKSMLEQMSLPRIQTYGLAPGLNWQAREMQAIGEGEQCFVAWREEALLGPFTLQIPGVHNVLNALAAIAATSELGVSLSTIQDSLLRFEGTARRFERKGTAGGVVVIDDYAHHPTEIRATLAAARARYAGRSLWTVFQPHTYSRFKFMLKDFAQSFDLVDHVIVTDIFAARESDTLGAHPTDLIKIMQHPDARYISGFENVVDYLAGHVRPGDVCLTLGAGDGYLIGEELLRRLAA